MRARLLFAGVGDLGHFSHRIAHAVNTYLLFAGRDDFAHTRHRIADALRTFGTEAHALTVRPHPYGYERDLTKGDLGRVVAIDWLSTTGDESMQIFDQLRASLPAPRSGIVSVHSGSFFRNNTERCLREDQKRGVQARFYGCDLIRLDDGAVPAFPAIVPAVAYGPPAPQYTEPPLRVAHAPSNRKKKGTEIILEAVRDLPGIELDLIEGETFTGCLARRGRAHVVIDQLEPTIGGFGTTTVEAMAHGQVVIADIRHCLDVEVAGVLELPPVLDVRSAEQLREVLIGLRDRPELYASARSRVETWAATVASPRAVARYWLEKLAALEG